MSTFAMVGENSTVQCIYFNLSLNNFGTFKQRGQSQRIEFGGALMSETLKLHNPGCTEF